MAHAVVHVSAEVVPFSKTGGLGDVAGALPEAVARGGRRAVTVSPAYGRERDGLAWDTGVRFGFWLFGRWHEVGFRVAEGGGGLSHVLVDHPSFQRGGAIYGDAQGAFGDNLFRFALLCRAALEVPRRVPLGGAVWGEEVHFHAHDWHASLLPVVLDALYKPLGLYATSRSVLSIHNAAHQGLFPANEFDGLDLPARRFALLDQGGALGLLRGGVVASDHVVAVSPGFADELCTEAGGFGLHGLLAHRRRQGSFSGFLNGIDDVAWDPATDPALPVPFSADHPEGKAACKAALQRECGLPQRPDVPLLGLVSRLDGQKGVDLLLELAPWLLAQDVQLVVLGSGAPRLEEGLLALARRWPRKVHTRIGFDVGLSRRLYGGCDVVLVPSLFEPCGLTQMYGMRYGAVPVVRAVGGLKDTVPPWNPATGQGKGWAFGPAEAGAFAQALQWALHTYQRHPSAWARVRENGMRSDWSWTRAALAYEALYRSLDPS